EKVKLCSGDPWFLGLVFGCDKRRSTRRPFPAEKPGKSGPREVLATHRFCGGGLKQRSPHVTSPRPSPRSSWFGTLLMKRKQMDSVGVAVCGVGNIGSMHIESLQ